MTPKISAWTTAALIAVSFWSCGGAAQTIAAPFTQDQADAGRQDFMTSCASCHGNNLSGATAPALTGASFNASWSKHTTADLYTFIKTTMPYCEGGTLANDAYTNIVAFILSKNGAKPGSEAFTGTTNAKISDIIPPAR